MSLHTATLFKNLKNKAVFPLKLFFKILNINEIIKSRLLASASFFQTTIYLNLRWSRPQFLCGFQGKHPKYTSTSTTTNATKTTTTTTTTKTSKTSVSSNDIGNNINLQNNRSNETKKSVFIIGDSTVKAIHSKNNFAYQFRQPEIYCQSQTFPFSMAKIKIRTTMKIRFLCARVLCCPCHFVFSTCIKKIVLFTFYIIYSNFTIYSFMVFTFLTIVTFSFV